MVLIREPLRLAAAVGERIPLQVGRELLARRRWRGVAADAREFGFDLERPLGDGDAFFEEGGRYYVIAQEAEAVIEIPLAGSAGEAAMLAWQIGNLHFPLEVGEGFLRVGDDAAVRGLMERAAIPFRAVKAVFRPMRAPSHGHH